MLRRVTDLCFLKMPVNAVQFRVTVRIFDNRKLILNLRFELPSCSKLSNNLPNYDPIYIFPIAFLFSKGCVSKISTKFCISIFLLFDILLGVLVWLCSCLMILSGDIEANSGPKNSVSECLSVEPKDHIGTWLFQIISFEDTYIGSQIWYYLSLRNISWFYCFPWWWKFGNFRV